MTQVCLYYQNVFSLTSQPFFTSLQGVLKGMRIPCSHITTRGNILCCLTLRNVSVIYITYITTNVKVVDYVYTVTHVDKIVGTSVLMKENRQCEQLESDHE